MCNKSKIILGGWGGKLDKKIVISTKHCPKTQNILGIVGFVTSPLIRGVTSYFHMSFSPISST